MTRARYVAIALIAVLTGCGAESSSRTESVRVTQAGSTRAALLLEQGMVAYKANERDSARFIWQAGLAEARSARDSAAMARLYTELGFAERWVGTPTASRAFFDSSIALKTRLGMRDELARSLNGQGLLELNVTNDNAEAARLFERSFEAAVAAQNDADAAKAMSNAGLAYGYMGDLIRARVGHRMLARVGRDIGNAYYHAQGLANEAIVDLEEGNPAVAIARLDSARALYRIADRDRERGEQNILVHLGTAAEAQGEYDRAFALFDSALTMARTHKLPEKEIEARRLLGGVHRRVGDHRLALNQYEEAIRLARQREIHADLASALLGAAESHAAVGNLPRAVARAEEALELHSERSDEASYQIEDLLLLAELDDRAGRPLSAARRLARADSIARRLPTTLGRADVAVSRARHADRRRDARGTLAALRVVDSTARTLDFELGWNAAALAARAYARLSLWDSAAVEGQRAVDAIERLRGRLSLESMRSVVASERSQLYGDYILTLLRLGREEDAFVVADRARSRGLVDRLSAIERGRARASVPSELVEGEEILRRIETLLQALRQRRPLQEQERGGVVAEAGAELSELEARRTEYEALMARAAKRTPRATAVLGAVTTRMPEVQRVLGREEALVEYFVAGDSVVVFILTAERLIARVLRVPEATITQGVKLLRDRWSRRRDDWQTGLPASRALYGALVLPVRRLLPADVRRLVIVPHGVLAQVPFAALRMDAPDQFLAEAYALVQAPSAAAFAASRLHTAGVRTRRATPAGFAPFRDDLPASDDEVNAFARSVGNAAQYLGDRATEAAVRNAVAGNSVVHIATHGVMNARNPMFSRVELARPERSGRVLHHDDGRLEVREVLSLEVRSPLLFLSGCETGIFEAWLDSPVRGAGDLTLSHALLSAGAANVVSTLWRIEDASAAHLADSFYRRLRSMGATEALVGAQRELLRDSKHANPYYWAAYVLSGEGRFSLNPQKAALASVY